MKSNVIKHYYTIVGGEHLNSYIPTIKVKLKKKDPDMKRKIMYSNINHLVKNIKI